MTELTKEQQILIVMRKVLAAVAKDTTPPPGMKHPLTDRTIQDMRDCFGLISAREHELAQAQGRAEERPYFTDEPQQSRTVSVGSIKKTSN